MYTQHKESPFILGGRVRFHTETWFCRVEFYLLLSPRSPSSTLHTDLAPLCLAGLLPWAFFFFLVCLLLRNGNVFCLLNPAAACRPLDKKRRPAAACSGRGGDAGRPGHLRPAALRLCWAGYRWCPSTGLSRGRAWGAGGPEGEVGKGVGREGRRPWSSQSECSPSADRFCLHQVHAGCGEHKAGRTEGAGKKPAS